MSRSAAPREALGEPGVPGGSLGTRSLLSPSSGNTQPRLRKHAQAEQGVWNSPHL